MVFQRFYGYPPLECGHPYILRNIHQKPQPGAIHEIVDIGIYDLLKVDDHKHSQEKLKKWEQLKTDGWKVVPDCFDLEKEFNIPVDFSNIEYSKQLIEKYYTNTLHEIPVIQSQNRDPQVIREYSEWLQEEYQPPLVALSGSVLRSNDIDFINRSIKILRRVFPESWIHCFALRLNHLRYVHKLIDSFDSSCWTFPREPGKSSCRNKKERIQYFYDYMDRIERHNPTMQQRLITQWDKREQEARNSGGCL